MAKPIYKCREEREPIAMMADASRRRPPAQDNDGSTQWGNLFQVQPGSHSQQAFQTFGSGLQRRSLPSSSSDGRWVDSDSARGWGFTLPCHCLLALTDRT